MITVTKIPELERLIILTMIQFNEVIDDLAYLKPAHFTELRTAYETLLKAYNERGEVDETDLLLNDIEINLGDYDIIQKTTVHQMAMKLVEHSRKKQLKKMLQKKMDELPSIEVIDYLKAEIDKVEREIDVADDVKPLGELLTETFKEVEDRRLGIKEVGLTLKTIATMNKIIGGIMPTDLVGIYGVEKSTKTSLAHEIILDLGADQKIPVAIFSFEMSLKDLIWKSISMRTGMDINDLRNPSKSRLSDEDYAELKAEAYSKLRDSKIFIFDRPQNELEIYNKTRQLKARHGIKLIVIDYLLLIKSIKYHDNLRSELNHLSRFFKLMTKTLEIPIILISQANESGGRAAEAKGLERDSNYFFSVSKCKKGDKIDFSNHTYVALYGDYLVLNRGIRHSAGGKGFIVRFDNNLYKEIYTRLC